ncbi:MAG: polysaccharide deacetylase family protein [bacterium]|nr:polysaccharide deacetylase family protein [bacterium]
MIKPLFPDGKEKCITFSYDDGVTQDRRLVELFNKYQIKGTFNLNSGAFGKHNPASGFDKPVTHNKIEASEVNELYAGHEVAIHTLTHPRLQYLSKETIAYEIRQDRENLEALVGYPVIGMAYPFGTYNDIVLEELKAAGIRYSRTVNSTYTFSMPQDFLQWHPTCHFGEEKMQEVLERFLEDEKDQCEFARLKVLYIWGHAYELDGNDTWPLMEELCERISDRSDIWYATNGEICSYNDAVNALVFSENKQIVRNESALPVWLMVNGQKLKVGAGECIRLDKINQFQ